MFQRPDETRLQCSVKKEQLVTPFFVFNSMGGTSANLN